MIRLKSAFLYTIHCETRVNPNLVGKLKYLRRRSHDFQNDFNTFSSFYSTQEQYETSWLQMAGELNELAKSEVENYMKYKHFGTMACLFSSWMWYSLPVHEDLQASNVICEPWIEITIKANLKLTKFTESSDNNNSDIKTKLSFAFTFVPRHVAHVEI